MKISLLIALLCATVWVACNIFLVAVVAPGVFAHAPPHAGYDFSKNVAGAVFGDLLGTWIAVVDVSLWPAMLALLGVLAGGALRVRRPLVVALSLIALVGLGGIHLASRATVQQARALQPPTNPADEAHYSEDRHQAFNDLHKRSVTLFAIETALLLGVMVGTAIALARNRVGASAADPTG